MSESRGIAVTERLFFYWDSISWKHGKYEYN